MLKLFGIPNCDTVKKTQKWLDKHGIEYEFHDYKKQGISKKQLTEWCNQLEWETLLNKRSRTWKQLNSNTIGKGNLSNLTQVNAINLMQQHPTLIKRPITQQGEIIVVGFNEETFKDQFK